MLAELRELYRYRELLLNLVIRDLKVRYKNSALGFFWSLLNPLLQVLVITVVFHYVLRPRASVANYPAYRVRDFSASVITGLIPWTFFQMSLLDASQSVLLHFAILKKVYFPREVLPMATVLANFVHFLLSIGLLFAYALVRGIHLKAMILLLPVVMLLHLSLSMGLAFFISALNVYYEDVKYVVSVLTNVLFYTTPVLYPSTFIGDPSVSHGDLLYNLYRLNPIAHLIIAYQKCFLAAAQPHDPRPLDPLFMLVTAAICLLMLVAGYAFYNSRKWEFAERL
jgi:ABC-type polysaccharide/polyol phosphate export permease